MGQFVILIVVALVAAALAWGVAALLMGRDPGLEPAEPDGRANPLPTIRPLTEADLAEVRFDITARGYRMAQVDQALRRVAYDIGYKEELVRVLEAETVALRAGQLDEADALREAREAAQRPPTGPDEGVDSGEAESMVLDDSPVFERSPAPEPAAEPAGEPAAEPAVDRAAEPAGEPAAAAEETIDGTADETAVNDDRVGSGARSAGTSEGQPGGGAT